MIVEPSLSLCPPRTREPTSCRLHHRAPGGASGHSSSMLQAFVQVSRWSMPVIASSPDFRRRLRDMRTQGCGNDELRHRVAPGALDRCERLLVFLARAVFEFRPPCSDMQRILGISASPHMLASLWTGRAHCACRCLFCYDGVSGWFLVDATPKLRPVLAQGAKSMLVQNSARYSSEARHAEVRRNMQNSGFSYPARPPACRPPACPSVNQQHTRLETLRHLFFMTLRQTRLHKLRAEVVPVLLWGSAAWHTSEQKPSIQWRGPY